MEIVSVFYAAFGYLALLGAILWGMLFVGDGILFPNMDAAGGAAPLEGAFVDLGLLLLALLPRSVSRGMLRSRPRTGVCRARRARCRPQRATPQPKATTSGWANIAHE
jgi:hypothetical protein